VFCLAGSFQDLIGEVKASSSLWEKKIMAPKPVKQFAKRKCCADGCTNNNLTHKMHSFPSVFTPVNGVKMVDKTKLGRYIHHFSDCVILY